MKKNKTFSDFIKLSKGEHKLEDVIEMATKNMETYPITYDATLDGLPKEKGWDDKERWD